MTKYEREQQQIEDALRLFPERFRLRAFPEVVMRVAPKLSHFVLHGEVQIVVQSYNPDTKEWRDFGRDSAANVRREMLPLLHERNL